jgi:hypothetical protein
MASVLATRGSKFGISDVVREYLGAGTVTAMDLVNAEAGEIVLASAGDFVAGVVLESGTSSSTGLAVNVTPGLVIVMDNDNVGTTFAVTHVGARFDITGTTGAQLVDTSTLDQTYGAPSGTLVCREYNPQDVSSSLDSDTSVGSFIIADQQF